MSRLLSPFDSVPRQLGSVMSQGSVPPQPVVPLATDRDRVASPAPELSSGQRERLADILAGPTVSLHDHPVRLPDPLNERSWVRFADSGQVFLGETGLSTVFASKLAGGTLDEAVAFGTAVTAQQNSGTTVLGALEDLGPIGTELRGLDALYGAGIRCAGLAYNTGTALAGGLGQDPDPGLSPVGRDAVRAMEELGMLVDLAHVGDRSSIEAARMATRPLVISHAGARTVWPTPRMKPDEVLRAVASTGGLIGIEAAPGSTRSRASSGDHDLDDVMHHLEYCAELIGIEHVALGPDTFFGDHLGLYAAAGWPRPSASGMPALDIEFVAGMENPAEAIPNAAAWLIAHGWADADIAAIVGGNAARLWEGVR